MSAKCRQTAPSGGPWVGIAGVSGITRRLPPAVQKIVHRLAAVGGNVAIVGGVVRDALLGQSPSDHDLVTDLSLAAIVAALPRAVVVGAVSATVIVPVAGTKLQISPLRGGPRRGSFVAALCDDLGQRDFTINAMAVVCPGETLVDPCAGALDLRRRLLRTPRSAGEIFAADPLRALRAVRFAASLRMHLDADVEPAARQIGPRLAGVAPQRLRDELVRLLGGKGNLSGAFAFLRQTGLASQVSPLLATTDGILGERISRVAPEHWRWRLAAWLLGCGADPAAAAAWLRLCGFARCDVAFVLGTLDAYRRLPCRRPPAGYQRRRWMADSGRQHARAAAFVHGAMTGATGFARAVSQGTRRARGCLAATELCLSGADLCALGLSGSAIGRVQKALLERVLRNPRLNRRRLLVGIARALSTGMGSAPSSRAREGPAWLPPAFPSAPP